MSTRETSLSAFAAATDLGVCPDDAVAALRFGLKAGDTVVPKPYLEPLPPRRRLQRAPAAVIVDSAARACVEARDIGTRLAVFVSHEMHRRRAFQRLGYRSAGDYAREQLGLTAREFRDMARLGGRLEALPATRAAFMKGELTRTQAEVVAAIAAPEDEHDWLRRAGTGTVRQLKAAARREREARRSGAASEKGASATPAGNAEPGEAADEPRCRQSFDVPPNLLGKIDAVLALVERVAGASMPVGARWELVAAEYLSGASPIPGSSMEGDQVAEGGEASAGEEVAEGHKAADGEEAALGDEAADAAGAGDARSTADAALRPTARNREARALRRPEDPRGYQKWCEGESRNWSFLPTARPRLDAQGEWRRLRDRCRAAACGTRADGTPWELHRDLQNALAAQRRVDWQLGRLLTTIRNRRLYRTMCFVSFSHYVRERLGISPRAAERLVRVDRRMWDYPPLRRAYQAGELSPLVADALVRVLAHVRRDAQVQRDWIDFALASTFEHFVDVVRQAERTRAAQPFRGRRLLAGPQSLERGDSGNGGASAAPDAAPPMFVTVPYVVWMADGERETLERAMRHVRVWLAAASDVEIDHIPPWTCLEALLDHFRASYDGEEARRSRARYTIFERDGWQCAVPGCSSFGPLHAHHIVFRAHGGNDQPDNLISLCDFHHKALHDRWIRCVGRAPDALYWELGTDLRDGPAPAPVLRVAGVRKLTEREFWDGSRVREYAPCPPAGDRRRRARSGRPAGRRSAIVNHPRPGPPQPVTNPCRPGPPPEEVSGVQSRAR